MEVEQIVLDSFLACKLSKENPTYTWDPEKLDESIQHTGDKLSKPKHSLTLKRVRKLSKTIDFNC